MGAASPSLYKAKVNRNGQEVDYKKYSKFKLRVQFMQFNVNAGVGKFEIDVYDSYKCMYGCRFLHFKNLEIYPPS